MLIRQTVRYLPAQLIGPLAQFGALVAWTHMLPPSDYGFLALVFAVQDLAYLICMSWWSHYILRYLPVLARSDDGIAMETSVLLISAVLQLPLALGCLIWTGHGTEGPLVLATIAFTLSRSLATYLGERARAEGRIVIYTVAQTAGPLFGLLLGLALFRLWPGAAAIIAGFAIVQLAAVPWLADRLGLKWRFRADALVSWPALRYGFPLMAAGAFGWLSINGIRLIVERHGGLFEVGLLSVGWNLAQRLIAVVAMLVTAAAFPLAVQTLAAEGRQKSLAQISRNGALFIGLLLPATIGLIAIGPNLSLALVGPEFRAATIAILPLAALAAAVRNLRVHFPDQVFLIIEQPGMALAICAFEAITTLLFCAIGLAFGGLFGACLGCLLAQILSAGVCFALVVVRHGLELPFDMVGRFGAAAALMTFVLYSVPMPPTLLGLGLQIMIGAVVYSAALAVLFRGAFPTPLFPAEPRGPTQDADLGPSLPPPHRLCLMHTMDPRGGKVGGIETHVRQIIARHPPDFELLFVGVDEIGDRRLGAACKLRVGGRDILFLPVARVPVAEVNTPARRLAKSVTLRFVLGAFRYSGAIRRALGGGGASADLHRYEYAPVARWLGLPAVQMVHGEGRRDQAMDSLIKRHWLIGRLSRWLALRAAARVLCVTSDLLAALEARPRLRAKAELLTVSVDTSLFRPQPFAVAETFRIIFAGRLDAFKNPPLMFATLAQLRTLLGGRLEFHYLGASDPSRFESFAAIADIAVLHGRQSSEGVAHALAACHAGIFTSEFEGLPCFLLEALASGRPVGAVALPQFAKLIEPGLSGVLVPHGATLEATAATLAAGFAALWADIAGGRLDPNAIARKAQPYSIDVQLKRLFETHRTLQMRQAGGRTSRVGAP